jgi:hypothetical protein
MFVELKSNNGSVVRSVVRDEAEAINKAFIISERFNRDVVVFRILPNGHKRFIRKVKV